MVDPRPAPARPWLLPAVVVAALTVLLLALVGWTSRDQTAPAPQATGATGSDVPDAPTSVDGPAAADGSDVERRDPDDLLAAGPVDAPVTLVVFSDYQCSFCARWSHDTLPVMLERAEAGDLRIEWRDVNIFGEDSARAARAVYAAAVQDELWAYHDALYPDGETLPASRLSTDALVDLAAELGLDTARFAADLDAPATHEQIAANQQLGLDAGAYSTPAFVLDGEPLVGAQPTHVFVDALDRALAAG